MFVQRYVPLPRRVGRAGGGGAGGPGPPPDWQAIEKLENRDKYSQQGDACLSEARACLARSELDKVRPPPLPPRARICPSVSGGTHAPQRAATAT